MYIYIYIQINIYIVNTYIHRHAKIHTYIYRGGYI